MNTRVKELFSNTLLFTIANMGSKIMVFLMVPLYTAILTSKEYGISDVVQTTATMLIPIFTVMIADSVLRFCFLKNYSLDEVLAVGINTTLKGVVICFLLCFFLMLLPFFKILGLYVLFIPIMFASNSMVNLLHKYARGIDKVKVSAFAGLFSTFVLIVLNLLFLVIFKMGILGYLIAYVCADFVAVIFMAKYCCIFKEKIFAINVNLQKEMYAYSIPLIPNSLSWWAISSVNRYIMLAWLGVSAVGIYSATLRIPSILTVICDIFAQAWLLSALKDYGSNESKHFIRLMHNSYFTLLILITSGIILLSHPLAKFLLSGEFSQYWRVVPYLFISVFYGALVGFLGSVFSAERKNSMQFISTMVGAFISILLTLVFLRNFGVIVVAIATMVGYYVIWLIRREAVRKYIDIGYSTFNASIQGLILLLEAFLVGNELYLIALVCLIALIVFNIKSLIFLFNFCASEIKCYYKK